MRPTRDLAEHSFSTREQVGAALSVRQQFDPYRISATVTVVINSAPGCCCAHQASTVAEGEGCIGSEMTFVSRMVIPALTRN